MSQKKEKARRKSQKSKSPETRPKRSVTPSRPLQWELFVSQIPDVPFAIPSGGSEDNRNNKKASPEEIVSRFLFDPVDIFLLRYDFFQQKVCISRTAFEEVELPSCLSTAYKPSAKERSTESDDPLHNTLRKLFIEALEAESGKSTPLTSFHLLLYKRLQILTAIEEQYDLLIKLQKQKKESFERIPLKKGKVTLNEEQKELVKNLEKVMKKKDRKKGLFGKFSTTRNKAIHQSLRRSAKPLSLRNVDVQQYQEYLLKFSCEEEAERKLRRNSLMSLLLLGIGSGSGFVLAQFLESIFDFEKIPLSPDGGEEEGYKIDGETREILYNFHMSIIQRYGNDVFTTYPFLTEDRYQIYSKADRVSCEQLVVFLMSHMDNLASCLLNRSLLNYNVDCMWIEYIVHNRQRGFRIYVELLRKLALDERYIGQLKMKREVLEYLVTCLLRIISLHIEFLALWKKRRENPTSSLLDRIKWKSGKVFEKLEVILSRMLKKFIKKKEICFLAANIIGNGISLFHCHSSKQRQYIVERIGKPELVLGEILVVKKMLENIVFDPEYFSWLVLKPVHKKEEDIKDFMDHILSFVEKQFLNILTTKKFPSNSTVQSCIDYSLSLLLLYQQNLSRKVSPMYTKFQKSSPKPSKFESFEGKLYLSHVKHILGLSCGMLKQIYEADLQDKEFQKKLLKESWVGKLLFPLLHSLVRLLWKNDNRVKYNLYHLTSFIYPFLLNLMESIHRINVKTDKKDCVFEYMVVETDHPYVGGLEERVTCEFSERFTLNTACIFHPRCRTAQNSDALVIGSSIEKTLQPLKFSGLGNTIPVNPLVTWGQGLNLSFKSEKQKTDWGMKVAIIPMNYMPWMNELERTVAWLGGRIGTYVLCAFPQLNDEILLNEFLSDRLFQNGLATAINDDEKRFYGEIMRKEGLGNNIVKFMDHHLSMESFVGRNNQEVLDVERSIIALLIKHAGLFDLAKMFCTTLSKVEGGAVEYKGDVPKQILKVWRSARGIRTWMIARKQTEQIEYSILRSTLLRKIQFLFQLTNSNYKTPSTTPKVLSDSEVKAEEEYVSKLYESVFKFLGVDIDLALMGKLLSMRVERSSCRKKAFDMFTHFMKRTSFPSVRAEIIQEFFMILLSSAMKKHSEFDFHYFNNLEGCGVREKDIITTSFYSFLKELVYKMDMNSRENILSGLVHYVLAALVISFKPTDVVWILDFKILKRLEPLLYDSGDNDVDSEVRFKQKSSYIEERRVLNKLAWKTFRLISIRCVDMLENWDNGLKFEIKQSERPGILKKLDILRNKIYQMIFAELEDMVKKDNLVGTVLEEMLLLLESLVSSKSSSKAFSSKRLLNLLLPLMNSDNPKLQQLSLKLYGQLVVQKKKKETEPEDFDWMAMAEEEENEGEDEDEEEGEDDEEMEEFRKNFVEVLLQILGTYEMGRIFGVDVFNEQKNIVGLEVAKEVFLLLRNLLQPSIGGKWTNHIKEYIFKYISEAVNLLSRGLSRGVKDITNYTPDDQKSIRFVLAVFLVYVGLDYVPEIEEIVDVRLQGRWEEARIVDINESRHTVRIMLMESCGIDTIQEVESEFVRVKTNDFIDSMNLNKPVIESLTRLVGEFGDIFFTEKANSFMTNFHLLFSSLWKSSLKMIHDSVVERRIESLESSGIVPHLVKISKEVCQMTYGEDLKLDSCSFSHTGKRKFEQIIYPCYTCELTKTKGVCAFCAKRCHVGHQLGTPTRSVMFCACGSDTNRKCWSLEKPPKDSKLSLGRYESLYLRLCNFVPLAASRRLDESPSAFISEESGNNNNFLQPSMFVNASQNTGYVIKERSNEISFSWQKARGFSMIGSDHPVPPNYTGYYFELTMEKMGKRKGGIAIGFAESPNRNTSWPQVLANSYTHHVRNGDVYSGTKFYEQEKGYTGVRPRDVFGCGWNKKKKEIYFTKNGDLLKTTISSVSSNRTFYPIILLHGEGCVVKPNLGTQKFKYNAYKTMKDSPRRERSLSRTFVFSPVNLESKMKEKIAELCQLGYEEGHVKLALERYEDMNSACAYLHRRAMRPRRYEVIDKFVNMGFSRALVIKSLEISNDDVNQALNWLLEEQHSMGSGRAEDGDSHKQIYADRGIPFLGANIDLQRVANEKIKTMLLYSYSKINLNAFKKILCRKVIVHRLVVVNPSLEDTEKKTNSGRLVGRLGAIIGKVGNGAYVQTVDTKSGSFLSAFVSNRNLLKVPDEMEEVTLPNLFKETIRYVKNIGVMYCRGILKHYMTFTQKFDLKRTFLNAPTLYRTIKVLCMKDYSRSGHTFIDNEPRLLKSTKMMADNLLDSVVVNEDGRKEEIFSFISGEAVNEITKYQEGKAYYRKVIFKKSYNRERIQVRFWGCSSIFICFFNRCVLPTNNDVLTFYFGNGKESLVFQGKARPIPRYLVFPGDRFWFHFQTTNLKENSGFQFHITPSSTLLPEEMAIRQPNLALASLTLLNTSGEFWKNHIIDAKKTFEICMNYLMTPFAPFKGVVGNAIEALIKELYSSQYRPNLNIMKAFRIELEDLYISFKTRSKNTDWPLPVFHSLVELMSVFRHYLSTDLCRSVFPYQDSNKHMYTLKGGARTNKREVICCTSCAMNNLLGGNVPHYHSHSFEKCGINLSKDFSWKTVEQERTYSNLIPIEQLKVSPNVWFEHTSWIDQLTIARELLTIFVNRLPIPNWLLYETALESKKKVVFRETPHPYTTLTDSGRIHIPGAKKIMITFHPQSKTHPLDMLLFSNKRVGGNDLGILCDTRMSGNTFVIWGNKIYYEFRCDGGEHKVVCRSCGKGIRFVRWFCSSANCDRFNLCSTCVVRPNVHNPNHIFVKFRRPISSLPANIPELYPVKWQRTPTYRGTVHKNIKCDGCGQNPILGIRYWCENCANYNLCQRCGETEYKFHNRLHVFLRIVRPLPPKKQIPNNHLPYGTIYNKDEDVHWGYRFTVTTEEKCAISDPSIQKLMEEIGQHVGHDKWDYQKDTALVQYVENYEQSWWGINAKKLHPSRTQLMNFPSLQRMDMQSFQYRFLILKVLNFKIAKLIHLLNMETASAEQKKSHTSINNLLALSRRRIFHSIKRDVWENTLDRSLSTIKVEGAKSGSNKTIPPVDLKLNRQKAVDCQNSPSKITAATFSLFNQSYLQLQTVNPQVMARRKAPWKVILLGEQADDYGGPFREALSSMVQELQSDQLDLFIRVPNGLHGTGEFREKYMPNPRARSFTHMKWYRFIGVMMGVGMLSKNELAFDFPSLFWKQFVKEPINLRDIQRIDESCYKSMIDLRNIHLKGVDKESFSDLIMETFTTVGSDGVRVELIKGGKKKAVTFENREEYAGLVEKHRLTEISKQTKAIRDGLFSIVPSRFSPVFTWREMEILICGKKKINLGLLRKHTVYEEYKKTHKVIKMFWRVLKSFTHEERSLYLRFVWGRSRLPISEDGWTHPHKVQRLDRPNPDPVLPLSHTCFFSIELPAYSSEEIMREKILYAITNCKAIDTDMTRSARNARNMT